MSAARLPGMDYHYLRALNRQLETLIHQRHRELSKPGLNSLFEAGCGFTEFLVRMFSYLPWPDIESCRLVSSTWRDFIDRLL